jgi:non-ribosomal peptide synthetase component E (peptide arylation enzyme)
MAKSDDLADALLNYVPEHRQHMTKIDQLFGDRPEVLEAIAVAYRDKKLSARSIADILSTEQPIGKNSVENWLKKQGLK